MLRPADLPAPTLRHDLARALDHAHDGVYVVDRRRRILYWNAAAERITGFSRGEVAERRCADAILMHVDDTGRCLCTSGCPLSATMADGASHEADVYLHHKEGHRVPVSVRVTPLEDDDGRIVGAIEFFSTPTPQNALFARMAELEKLALLDPLTRLPNRRHLTAELDAQLAMLRRSGVTFGALFFDIDRFKRFNDQFGHAAGDAALQTVAKTLVASARPFDTVGRWGGEEFVGIYPNVTTALLETIATRLAMLVRRSRVELVDRSLPLTVSIGGAVAQASDTTDTLIARADARMYDSKNAGRDTVTIGS
jgi:diguanylate cyclase (GGDEF)-like protein/PAS domain S-box-containing protein